MILKSLESSFLVVTPIYLVGLTLLSEVSQGCCNCRKARNESAVVANKTQEGPDVVLRYRSGDLSSNLHFARIWLDDPPTKDVPKIGNLGSPEVALMELQNQPSGVKTTENLPEVSRVFFPVLTEHLKHPSSTHMKTAGSLGLHEWSFSGMSPEHCEDQRT